MKYSPLPMAGTTMAVTYDHGAVLRSAALDADLIVQIAPHAA
jgi:hypothetical protein